MLKSWNHTCYVLDNVQELLGGQTPFLGLADQVRVDGQSFGDHVHHVVAHIGVALENYRYRLLDSFVLSLH